MSTSEDDVGSVIAGVGPRLRKVRSERGTTLSALADTTGISVSTLSRLESGSRKPSLELLLPIARAHQIPLDELISPPPVEDPRIKSTPVRREHVTIHPLTRRPGGMQAYKLIVDPVRTEPSPRVHEG
ncbi:MAG: helix-turn-helix transcriptional regulator, partial [Rhodococcus fascians]